MIPCCWFSLGDESLFSHLRANSSDSSWERKILRAGFVDQKLVLELDCA